MTSQDVLGIYKWLEENGVAVWIDGGWCVDALLGMQTREHADLDIAVHRKKNAKLRQLLVSKGYREEKRSDSTEYMYVLSDAFQKRIDVHVFEYDENGKNVYGIAYPFGSLTGTGLINGQEVKCVDQKFMFEFKTGYAPKVKDLQDVRALSNRFGFKLPSRYAI